MATGTARLRTGDRVRIADRTAGAQDAKSGLYYNHYRGLVGIVQKVYGSETAVEIELECLPEEIWKRHMQVRDQMRERWLEGLSPEAKRKLTPEQKQFELRYVVLVATDDLQKRRAPSHKSA